MMRERYTVVIGLDNPQQAYIIKPGKEGDDQYLTVCGVFSFEPEFARDLCEALNVGRDLRFADQK